MDKVIERICEIVDGQIDVVLEKYCVPNELRDRYFSSVCTSRRDGLTQAWVTIADADCPIHRAAKEFVENANHDSALLELYLMVNTNEALRRQIYAATEALIRNGVRDGFRKAI